MRRRCRSLPLLAAIVVFVAPAFAQTPAPTSITADNLRQHLFRIADDSVGGRDPGSQGNFQATEYVAAQFQRAGLVSAGENGTWFQAVPFVVERLDESATMTSGSAVLKAGTDFIPASWIPSRARNLPSTATIYGGDARDSPQWISAEQARGRAVVLSVESGTARSYVRTFALISHSRWRDAAAVLVSELDLLDAEVRRDQIRGVLVVDAPADGTLPPLFLLTPGAADPLFDSSLDGMKPGQGGRSISYEGAVRRDATPYPARNVSGVLPGSDAKLKGQYVALTAHNDHVGLGRAVVEHDSISNGADDDGSGTVSLIVLAQALGQLGGRPRRSVLFVSHTGEEYGLVGRHGSPTIPPCRSTASWQRSTRT